MNKVTVLGAGSWGTALAQVLADNGLDVCMWTVFDYEKEEINKHHTNKQYFEDVILPDNIFATNDLSEAISFSNYILIVVPTKFMRETLKNINNVITGKKLFINASKGIEPGTHKTVSEIITEEINGDNRSGVVILSGPSHAEEVIKRMITTVSSVSNDINAANEVQGLFSNNYFRVYTHTDLKGAEIASSLKNVIAIASGIISGLGYGDNTRAALITRGLTEIIRYGKKFDTDIETFIGLTGIGDLIVTATSRHSRNFNAGYKIAQGMDPKEVVEKSKMVVEGVRTAKAVYESLEELNIEMPIFKGVYEVFYEGKEPKIAIDELMQRNVKSEKEHL